MITWCILRIHYSFFFIIHIFTSLQFDREHFNDVFVDLKWFESKVGNKYLNEAAGLAAEKEAASKEAKKKQVGLQFCKYTQHSLTVLMSKFIRASITPMFCVMCRSRAWPHQMEWWEQVKEQQQQKMRRKKRTTYLKPSSDSTSAHTTWPRWVWTWCLSECICPNTSWRKCQVVESGVLL